MKQNNKTGVTLPPFGGLRVRLKFLFWKIGYQSFILTWNLYRNSREVFLCSWLLWNRTTVQPEQWIWYGGDSPVGRASSCTHGKPWPWPSHNLWPLIHCPLYSGPARRSTSLSGLRNSGQKVMNQLSPRCNSTFCRSSAIFSSCAQFRSWSKSTSQ